MGPLGEYLESIENYINKRDSIGPVIDKYDEYNNQKKKYKREIVKIQNQLKMDKIDLEKNEE